MVITTEFNLQPEGPRGGTPPVNRRRERVAKLPHKTVKKTACKCGGFKTSIVTVWSFGRLSSKFVYLKYFFG